MAEMLAQSGVCRRIVGRVDRGEDPCTAIADICTRHGIAAGEVRATGVLSNLELSELAPAGDSTNGGAGGAYRPIGTIQGDVTLIQAYGNVSKLGDQTLVIMRALVSWNDRGQHRVAGGHMLSAETVTVEFVIDAFDDLTLERALDPTTGMPVLSTVTATTDTTTAAAAPAARPSPRPTPNPSPAPAAPPPAAAAAPAPSPAEDEPAAPIASRRPSGWDMVAAASQALDEEPEDDWTEGLDAELKRGDVLLHPRFGRCKVLRVEDEERVVLMDEDRKPRTVALEYIRIQRDQDVPADQTVYQVRIGRG